jgi:hypothetical protein
MHGFSTRRVRLVRGGTHEGHLLNLEFPGRLRLLALVPRRELADRDVALSAVAASAPVYARIGWTAPLPAACCLCAAGPPLAASDLAEHRLPDKLTLPATALTAVLLITASWHSTTQQRWCERRSRRLPPAASS